MNGLPSMGFYGKMRWFCEHQFWRGYSKCSVKTPIEWYIICKELIKRITKTKWVSKMFTETTFLKGFKQEGRKIVNLETSNICYAYNFIDSLNLRYHLIGCPWNCERIPFPLQKLWNLLMYQNTFFDHHFLVPWNPGQLIY